MTEDEARQWIIDRFGVPRETVLQRLVDLILDESQRQNLISSATADAIWSRHVVDSAQLLSLVPDTMDPRGLWLDIGSGAGFPGLLVAALVDRPVMLVEPRRKRADFLHAAATALGLDHQVTVVAKRVEQIDAAPAIISARAVAAAPELFRLCRRIATRSTLWLLPKGINAREEVEAARQTWHGVFHVEPSITQPGSQIIVATEVSPR